MTADLLGWGALSPDAQFYGALGGGIGGVVGLAVASMFLVPPKRAKKKRKKKATAKKRARR